MFYIIGDIHGELEKLMKVIAKISVDYQPSDLLIFLGDYIDRGYYSFEVVTYLLNLQKSMNCFFLMGNHEDMLYKCLIDKCSPDHYMRNGGKETVRSYEKNLGKFKIPEDHKNILFSNNFFYEGDDFIAVHAGLPPGFEDPSKCFRDDLLWIREKFYRSDYKWRKKIIFGHTPVYYINKDLRDIYYSDINNIAGIDTGAVYGYKLSCIRMPDGKIFQS